MTNDRLLELVKKSGAVITINTDGKLWAITLTSIDQLHTLYELIRKEVVPEGCHVVAMDDEDIMVKQGAGLIAAHRKGESDDKNRR